MVGVIHNYFRVIWSHPDALPARDWNTFLFGEYHTDIKARRIMGAFISRYAEEESKLLVEGEVSGQLVPTSVAEKWRKDLWLCTPHIRKIQGWDIGHYFLRLLLPLNVNILEIEFLEQVELFDPNTWDSTKVLAEATTHLSSQLVVPRRKREFLKEIDLMHQRLKEFIEIKIAPIAEQVKTTKQEIKRVQEILDPDNPLSVEDQLKAEAEMASLIREHDQLCKKKQQLIEEEVTQRTPTIEELLPERTAAMASAIKGTRPGKRTFLVSGIYHLEQSPTNPFTKYLGPFFQVLENQKDVVILAPKHLQTS